MPNNAKISLSRGNTSGINNTPIEDGQVFFDKERHRILMDAYVGDDLTRIVMTESTTFSGTLEEWENLTDEEKAKYTYVYIEGDYVPPNNIMVGASASENGNAGLAPQPLAGEENKALFGDATYKEFTTGQVGSATVAHDPLSATSVDVYDEGVVPYCIVRGEEAFLYQGSATSINYSPVSIPNVSVTPTNVITGIESAKVIVKPWATATDEELKAIVDAYYSGDLTLSEIQEVWKVGDERTVSLSAMEATGVSESHVAQDVIFTILNFGGKTLSNNLTCLAIVGQKDSLKEYGNMNPNNSNAGGWDLCPRRTWCNSVYKNALPSTFGALFKEHRNNTSPGSIDYSATTTSLDYFAFASEKEVFGTTTNANATSESSNTQFKYYETEANRIKKLGGTEILDWWERSPTDENANSFCKVKEDGSASASMAFFSGGGIAPFGCI